MQKRKIIITVLGALGAALLLSPVNQAVQAANNRTVKAKIVSKTDPVLKKTAYISEVSGMDVMCSPNGITAIDANTLLVADSYHKRLWMVHSGTSQIYAGGDTSNSVYGEPMGGYNDAGRLSSYFKSPYDVTKFLDGWAVSDTDNSVVRIVSNQNVGTVNGKVQAGMTVSDMGMAFNRPTGLTTDKDGNLYIADTGIGAIFKVNSDGIVTLAAGGLNEPMGICWKNGILYVAESGANRIVKIEKNTIIPIAGTGEAGMADGKAEQATFDTPRDLEVSDDGVIYVSDTLNAAIRRIYKGKVDTMEIVNNENPEFSLISPSGLVLQGERLYICDSFARKLFVMEWKQ